MSSIFRVIPTTQQYDWGKLGLTSKVAQLAASSQARISVDESKPYAELWMGTHPTSPSHLASEPSTTLSEYLKDHPALIGDSVLEEFWDAKDGNLPFLFKVLSIQKALSIQTHPDKPTAERLHAQLPDIYKDANHKPELALALTPFQALCGFQPLEKVAATLKETPELCALIPDAIVEAFGVISHSGCTPESPAAKIALRDLFSSVMDADRTLIKEQVGKLVDRYQKEGKDGKPIKELVLTLNEQFPNDIGIFCAFLLNHITLKPGEAIFLGAGEPHAYVSGDIIECMANSDNVIRAGLTPKLIDIPNLVSGLTYIPGEPQRHQVHPTSFTQTNLSTLYDPPIPEFSVTRINIPSDKEETHRAVAGPSLVIVTDGEGEVTEIGQVTQGDVFFIGADKEVKYKAKDKSFGMYRAFVEVPRKRNDSNNNFYVQSKV